MSATRTLAQLAQEALNVQDACNLTGVVHGYSRALSDLRTHAEAGGHGTDWINRHPIAVAWADKIASLTGIQAIGCDRALDAFRECDIIAHQK
jgi:hypothetical protein